MKGQPAKKEKTVANHIPDRGLIAKIYLKKTQLDTNN